jgi:hypothetical protein
MSQNSRVETIVTQFDELTLAELGELSQRLNFLIDQKKASLPVQAILPQLVQLTKPPGVLSRYSVSPLALVPGGLLVPPLNTIQREIACVRIQKLIAVKVNKGIRLRLSSPKEYELHISICIDHPKVPCKGGSIRVGLKRGDLEFDFQNVDFYPNTSSNRLPSAKEMTNKVSWEPTIGLPLPSAKLTQGREIKTELEPYLAWTISSSSNPVRRYEVVSIDCLVEGEQDSIIGSLRLQGQSNPRGGATFVIREQKDLHLFDPDGIWPKILHKNKIAFIKAMLHKDIFKRLRSPNLAVRFE